MAWILGLASEQEAKFLRNAGYEVTTLNEAQEIALFGGVDEERIEDKLVMVWVDANVVSFLDVPGRTW